MNWYKKAQQELQEYDTLMEQSSPVSIIGTGQGEMLQIPGGQSINAGTLMQQVRSYLIPVLQQKGVHTIDTSPVSNPSAQGLAISHEPGIIHIDVQKIFNTAKQSLPPTAQLDAVSTDPDIMQSIIAEISNWILGELIETTAHESAHVQDYLGAYQSGQPFTGVQEHPAEQFGQQVRQQQGL